MAPRLACKGAAQDCSRVKSFLEHDVEALATLLMRGCGSFLVCLHQSPLAFLHFSIVFAQHGHCDNIHSRMCILVCLHTLTHCFSAFSQRLRSLRPKQWLQWPATRQAAAQLEQCARA